MATVYMNASFPDAERRGHLYAGDLFVYSPGEGSSALCALARRLSEDAFSPHDPRFAQDHMPAEEYAAILADLKPRFIHHPEAKQAIATLLRETGCDTTTTYFDVPRLRTMASGDYLKAGLALQFHAHRDTWFSAPYAQLNWWLPVYEVEAGNSMAFHPRYFDRPVKNSSAGYDYDEWNRTGRKQAAKQISKDTRKQPYAGGAARARSGLASRDARRWSAALLRRADALDRSQHDRSNEVQHRLPNRQCRRPRERQLRAECRFRLHGDDAAGLPAGGRSLADRGRDHRAVRRGSTYNGGLSSAARDTTTAFGGRTALVTGAGGGIGGAIAIELARRGATVGLVGRRPGSLDTVARRLEGDGAHTHTTYAVDLTDDAKVRGLTRSFLRKFGRLDLLVHSNGIHRSGTLGEAALRDFDRLWAANVRGPFLLTQLLVPALRDTRGQIAFVNSSVGLDTRPGVGQFSATQHALRALADTFRLELNDDGIRVLNVYPGRTATGRVRRIFASEGRAYTPEQLLQAEDVAALVCDALALPPTAEVTDIRVRPAHKH